MYIKRSFGSVHKNLGEFKTIWTCPPNVLDLKRTQAKMSFTVYMQIEPSATEKVNYFLGEGIVNTLNKTANENNLDLAILKNAVGHTILDVDSLEDEIGKLRAYQKY